MFISLTHPETIIWGVIHELRVLQVELAQQNEKLRDAQLELEQSRAQYLELYDNAPVGYFTFDNKGSILEVNHTGRLQLGLEKDVLRRRFFPSFMFQDDSDLFYLHLKKVFATGSKQTCALTLFQENGKPFYAQLDSISSCPGANTKPRCQTTVTDSNECWELEEALNNSDTGWRIEGKMVPPSYWGRIRAPCGRGCTNMASYIQRAAVLHNPAFSSRCM